MAVSYENLQKDVELNFILDSILVRPSLTDNRRKTQTEGVSRWTVEADPSFG